MQMDPLQRAGEGYWSDLFQKRMVHLKDSVQFPLANPVTQATYF